MKPAIILVSPKGAANVGGIARLMGNFGLEDLRIVAPRFDLQNPECKMRSLGAYSIIEKAKLYENLSDAQRDLEFSFAFSMQEQKAGVPSYDLSDFFERSAYSFSRPWAFVFGREDNGLSADELLRCNAVIWIPTKKDFPSINLTSSVAIALFQWFDRFEKSKLSSASELEWPKKKDEEVFFEGLKSLLKEIEFMKTNSDHILDDLRNMYRRARISDRDLRILFGILSDIGRKWNKRFFPKNEKL